MQQIEFNKVTWYSNIIAVIVFLAVWLVGFYLGARYQASRAEPAADGAVSQPAIIAPVGNEVALGAGETGEVNGVRITFNALANDYRCPIDVQCIQAGAVVANVTFRQGPHLEQFNMPSDEVPRRFENQEISIVNVMPPLKAGQEIDPKSYKVTFRVATST